MIRDMDERAENTNGPEDMVDENDWELAARSLLEELGIEVNYAPDHLAPPINGERLRALVRRELSHDEVLELCQLIATYRSWHAAWVEIVREEPQSDHDQSG